MKLTCMYIWRNVCELGYTPLESVLSTENMADELLFCVDPDSGSETIKLTNALVDKFSDRARVMWFKWPIGKSGDGSVIGQASNFCLANVRTEYCCNIQSDEVYPEPLTEWIKDNWTQIVARGYDGLFFKVLHTEKNCQFFQGGSPWDGRKDTKEWDWQSGAGYNKAIKLAKHCQSCAIRFSHDAWSFDNCAVTGLVNITNEYPIIHLHDFFRDHYIAMRRNAADNIWTDREKFGHYKASADKVEETAWEWHNHPAWEATTSPFGSLLPWYAKRLLGKVRYEVNYDLLRDW